MVILKAQNPVYFPIHGLPMGALPVEAVGQAGHSANCSWVRYM